MWREAEQIKPVPTYSPEHPIKPTASSDTEVGSRAMAPTCPRLLRPLQRSRDTTLATWAPCVVKENQGSVILPFYRDSSRWLSLDFKSSMSICSFDPGFRLRGFEIC